MERTVKDVNTVKIPSPAIQHKGTVRMGAYTPAFPPVRTEPAKVADTGRVELGAYSPPFPSPRAK